MIAVVQRVKEASVAVDSEGYRARIDRGLCILLAVERGDTEREAAWMASKCARLRLFPDERNKMNRSVQEVGGAVLLVSQFTLAGDCARGNRPSFARAADPGVGQRLYELVADHFRGDHGLPVSTGVFGAHMVVSVTNDGPVTVVVERKHINPSE